RPPLVRFARPPGDGDAVLAPPPPPPHPRRKRESRQLARVPATGSPRRERRGVPLAGTSGCCTSLSPAHARQNLVGGRQLEARLEPEQGGDAADDGTPDRHRI